MKFAVDFDKTLTTGEGVNYWVDPFDERPNEEMIATTNEMYYSGHTVFVYTARDESIRRETEMWLDRWGVKYDALVMEKLGFDVLVDDRALNPDNGVNADKIEELVNE